MEKLTSSPFIDAATAPRTDLTCWIIPKDNDIENNLYKENW